MLKGLSNNTRHFSPGAGIYFHSRAISGFIMCLAGQIQVKYDNSKLKKQAFAGRMWPAGRKLPPPVLAHIWPPVPKRDETKHLNVAREHISVYLSIHFMVN